MSTSAVVVELGPEDWAELMPRIRDEEIVCNLARAPWPYEPGHARDFAARPQDRRFPSFVVTLPSAEQIRRYNTTSARRNL